jgi:hypothetical protein
MHVCLHVQRGIQQLTTCAYAYMRLDVLCSTHLYASCTLARCRASMVCVHTISCLVGVLYDAVMQGVCCYYMMPCCIYSCCSVKPPLRETSFTKVTNAVHSLLRTTYAYLLMYTAGRERPETAS